MGAGQRAVPEHVADLAALGVDAPFAANLLRRAPGSTPRRGPSDLPSTLERVHEILADHPGYEADAALQDHVWAEVREEFASDLSVPFDEQWKVYQQIYGQRPPEAGPPRAWTPTPQHNVASNIGQLMREKDVANFRDLHRWSADERGAFWSQVVDRLDLPFARPPDRVLDESRGSKDARWLVGARYNIADACFQAPAGKVAMVIGRDGNDGLLQVTYGELETLTNRFANALRAKGLQPGDTVGLYMPMTVECVAAYLGIVRAGMAVVSIADSFAPPEVASRLKLGGAKALVTVHRVQRGKTLIPLYEKAKQAKAPFTIVLRGETPADAALQGADVWWDEFLSANESFASVVAGPEQVTNVLFSSGTTGEPKAIPWTQLTPIKAAMDGHFHQDIHPVDVVAWPTNIGWMMGPWLIYASLVNHATMALYEGVPTSPGFCKFIERAGVTVFGLVPALVLKWRETGATEGCDWSNVRLFSSTGESSNTYDYLWLMSRTGYNAPVVEYCGGTEIGGGHLTGTIVQSASPATFTTPALGLDFVILDGDGQRVPEGAMGELYLIPPSIGLSNRLLNRDHDEVYYKGCPPGPDGDVLRRHGDQVARLPGGWFQAHGRADDTMNLGGIKVSSIELERAMNAHPDVSETAAVAVQPPGGGADLLVVFAVPRREGMEVPALKQALQGVIRESLNPLFHIHDIVLVPSLPRTASNKVMRRELRAQYGNPRLPARPA